MDDLFEVAGSIKRALFVLKNKRESPFSGFPKENDCGKNGIDWAVG